jgi:hypothetical protein|nr:MAG TPA: hypothetical protein [Caudoviricetes sp.]
MEKEKIIDTIERNYRGNAYRYFEALYRSHKEKSEEWWTQVEISIRIVWEVGEILDKIGLKNRRNEIWKEEEKSIKEYYKDYDEVIRQPFDK